MKPMGRVGFWGKTTFSESNVVPGLPKYVRPGMYITWQIHKINK